MKIHLSILVISLTLTLSVYGKLNTPTQNELRTSNFTKKSNALQDSLYRWFLDHYDGNPNRGYGNHVFFSESGNSAYLYLKQPIEKLNAVSRDSVLNGTSEYDWSQCGATLEYLVIARFLDDRLVLRDLSYAMILAGEGCLYYHPRLAINESLGELAFTAKKTVDSSYLGIYSFNQDSIVWSHNVSTKDFGRIDAVVQNDIDQAYWAKNYKSNMVFSSKLGPYLSPSKSGHQENRWSPSWAGQINYSPDSSHQFQIYFPEADIAITSLRDYGKIEGYKYRHRLNSLKKLSPQLKVSSQARMDTINFPIYVEYNSEHEGNVSWNDIQFDVEWNHEGNTIVYSVSADPLEESLGIIWSKNIWSE